MPRLTVLAELWLQLEVALASKPKHFDRLAYSTSAFAKNIHMALRQMKETVCHAIGEARLMDLDCMNMLAEDKDLTALRN